MAQRQPAGDYFTAIKQNAPIVLSGIKELAGAQIKPSVKHVGVGAGMMGGTAALGLAGLRFFVLALAFLVSWLFSLIGLSVLFCLFLGFVVAMLVAFGLAGVLALKGVGQFKKVSGPKDALEQLSTTMADVSQAVSAGSDIAVAGPPRRAGDDADEAAPAAPRPHYVVDPIWAAKQRAAERAAAKAAKADD